MPDIYGHIQDKLRCSG